MSKITGAQALVKSMLLEGIRTVFGIPGAGQYEAIDALWETPEIQYISVRHEQASTYMADGYARASGEVAAAIVVPGPGLFNSIAGIATADDLSSPMLVITGNNLFRDSDRTDETAWLNSIAVWTAKADHAYDIPNVVHEAIKHIKTKRPGPAIIQVPQEILAEITEINLIEPEKYDRKPADLSLVSEAATLLKESARPLIWAGGGVHTADASNELLDLAEYLQSPVVSTANGKGAIPDNHPLSLGFAELRYPPLNNWIHERDFIFTVGTRTVFSNELKERHMIHLDIDPALMDKNVDSHLHLTGDAKSTLRSLLQILKSESMHPKTPPYQEIADLLERRFAKENVLEPQQSFIDSIRQAVPENAIVVQGMNQMGYYSRNYLPVYGSRTYLTASHHGTLGHALPVGLGAKLARPDRAVIILSGDGGFLYNSQEMATAVKYGINVITLVFNDNAYGNVLRAQTEEFEGHVLGTRLHNPDFTALAEAYGARGIKANDPNELTLLLRDALSQNGPTVIEIPVGKLQRVY